MRFHYPSARRADVVDDYHGTLVSDPFRWLEDPASPETAEFVGSQNALSLPYLDGLSEVADLKVRMQRMWDVERTFAPQRRNGVTVWAVHEGRADQPRYMAEVGNDRRILLDPNVLAADGTVAVIVSSLSPDGAHWAYSTAEGGTDWQVIRIRSTATGRDLDDELRFVKFTAISWWRDGFFYSRFPEQDPASTEPSRHQAVMYHRVGTSQGEDVEWFANRDDPDLGYDAMVTHDDAWLVVTEWNGTARENGVLVLALPEGDDEGGREWHRVVDHGHAVHDVIDAEAGALLVVTDRDAPRKRIVRLDLDGRVVEEVVPESEHPIEMATACAGHVAVVRLEDAAHTVEIVDLDGSSVTIVDVPKPGTVSALSGAWHEPDLFVGYESFTHPPSVVRWAGDGMEAFGVLSLPFDPAMVVVERSSATSSDGVDVPMFVVRRVDADLPGPVELYGYGGFTVNMTPFFNPAWLAFVEAGGVVAVANLRGGTEFGEEWHRQGMLGNKQQVFDDAIACAEELIACGVAAPGSVGLRGRSNGGLLAAACMVQRPDLFGAVVSQVPVADMLRYQHFTAGRYWTVEYGDAGDPQAFEWLFAYSPYHRALEMSDPPPLLITTAESDDRVVPMHAFKLAAAVQSAAGGASEQPLLLRTDTRSGHGLGKPISKLIEEYAHVFGFLLHHLRPALEKGSRSG